MIVSRLAAMLGSVSIVCVFAVAICSAQVAYSRVVPYDPRYIIRRVPVRRSVEAEPRIRLPITRYFPQVDTQVASAPYFSQEAVAPAAAYRLSNGEIYAVPAKWSEEVIPVSALERNDDNDYDTYEYDNELNPVYARAYSNEFAVAQEPEPQEVDGDLYNDLMVNYLLGDIQPVLDETEISEVQRRSGGLLEPQALPSLDGVAEENKKQNDTKAVGSAPISAPSTPPPTTSSPPVAASTPAVPKKDLTSAQKAQNDFGEGPRSAPMQNGLWRDFGYDIRGQKEYPLYRPFHSSSPMASLENKLSRAKNSPKNKDALPLIEKMLHASAGRDQDPLQDQLDSLKFRNM